jgi:membrane-associated protease RseP (regulator of RpoE activity)
LEEEYHRVDFKYGLVTVKTRRLLGLLDKLGSYRITKPLAWFMLVTMPIGTATAFLLILGPISVLLSPQGPGFAQYIRTITPLANLLLPGINPYVPVVYGWIALIIAMVVHEGSHGIVARSLGMPVKASGLIFFLIVPIGAFVEIDEKILKEARKRDTARVLAGGPGMNLIVAVVSLLLLFSAVSTMTPGANGVAVVGVNADTPQFHSAAALAGIKPGDIITKMNNVPISDALRNNVTLYRPGNVVNLTIWRSGQNMTFTNLTLGNITELNTNTNKTTTRAAIGVNAIQEGGLQNKLTTYLQGFRTSPLSYVCIPTLPRCQDYVPYSDQNLPFYKSSLGGFLPIAVNLLFWIYFVNFNLAIFNSLPIYPMDGGQAFDVGLRALGRGKISEDLVSRVRTGVALALVAVLLFIIIGPYLLFGGFP